MHKFHFNKFQDSYQILEKDLKLCFQRKKNSRTHKECFKKKLAQDSYHKHLRY
jgi:hypothetical protein